MDLRYSESKHIWSMPVYQAPRGTADLLPQDQKYWRYIEHRIVDVCKRFGYQRIDTPLLESAGLFARSVGEETDVVQKETYTFEDRGGDLLTLRPEGTAPICRAYLEHGMSNLPQPVRLYYFCPIFRYERPQAGRYREHHQFGIEAIGDGNPLIDAEVIQIAWTITQELHLKGLSLLVNTIGDGVCRPGYLQKLRDYYEQHLGRLCSDCQIRYAHNPLRLLDCKQDSCQPYISGAPHSADHLCAICQEYWDALREYLIMLEIPFLIEPRLVRGLDYYTRSVFEIQPTEAGGQSTLVGGGRYDGLVEELGGRPTPGIGFGAGIERLILNLKHQQVAVPAEHPRPVAIVYLGNEAKIQGLALATKLRNAGLSVLIAPASRSLRAQMRYASSVDARFTVVIGEDELAKVTAAVRDMDGGTQEEVPQAQLVEHIQRKTSSSG